jgi:hypothetical protein
MGHGFCCNVLFLHHTAAGGSFPAPDPALLAANPGWAASGFDAFERVIYAFLLGVQETGAVGSTGVCSGTRWHLDLKYL